MRRMKKLVAMLLALAMVMGMSLTAFATPAADPQPQKTNITITNVGKNATVQWVKIVEPDRASTAGWKVVDAVADLFTDTEKTFLISDTKQTGTDNSDLVNILSNKEFTSFDGQSTTIASVDANGNGTVTFEVTEAGLYYVRIVEQVDTDREKTIATYNPIAVKVTYDKDGKIEKPADVNAKKTTHIMDKDMTDDAIVAVGEVLSYEVKSFVPYIEDDNANAENSGVTGRYYYIYDKIKGASYVDASGDVVAVGGKVPVKVSVGGAQAKDYEATVVAADTGFDGSFKLDLTDILGSGATANVNANKQVVVTYQAKVSGLAVYNEANATGNVGDEDYGSDTEGKDPEDPDDPDDPDDPRTGSLTLIKTGDNGALLAGAGFVIKNEEGKYAVCEATDTEGEYKFTGTWIEAADAQAAKATTGAEVFTAGTEGKVVVKGFGDGKYTFVETTAPTGYKLAAETEVLELTITDEETTNGDNTKINPSDRFANTKLSSLPSTGGMGTMIFTIGGCLIMIIAAGLFFASRRKSAK